MRRAPRSIPSLLALPAGWLTVAALLTLAALPTLPASAAPPGKELEESLAQQEAAGGAEQRALEEAYLRAATPGEHHAFLAAQVGTWDLTVTMWPAPGSPGLAGHGRLESRWILGRRFLESHFRAEVAGTVLEGKAIDGYDNLAEEYQTTWVDNTSTAVTVYRGTCDASGKVRTMTASYTDPVSERTGKTRGVTTRIDADDFRYDAYLVGEDGKSFHHLEMLAKRRAAQAPGEGGGKSQPSDGGDASAPAAGSGGSGSAGSGTPLSISQ